MPPYCGYIKSQVIPAWFQVLQNRRKYISHSVLKLCSIVKLQISGIICDYIYVLFLQTRLILFYCIQGLTSCGGYFLERRYTVTNIYCYVYIDHWSQPQHKIKRSTITVSIKMCIHWMNTEISGSQILWLHVRLIFYLCFLNSEYYLILDGGLFYTKIS